MNASSSGIAVRNFDTLTIDSGAVFKVAGNAPTSSSNHAVRQVVRVYPSGLSISGKLDLEGNDMIVGTGSLSSVTSLVKSGLSGSSGITSSYHGTYQYSSTDLTTLGTISAASSGTFDGEAINTGDVLVKYTYVGDFNIDGKVDGSDYTIYDDETPGSSGTWINGDANYDGVINSSDGALLDNTYDWYTGGGSSPYSPFQL